MQRPRGPGERRGRCPKKGHTEEQMVAVLRQGGGRAGGRHLAQGGDQPCDFLPLLPCHVRRRGMQKIRPVGRFSVPDLIDLDRADRTDHLIDRSAAPCNARRTGPNGSDANCFGNNLLDAAMALIPTDAGYHPHFVVNQVATKVTISPSATADRTTRTIVQRVLWRSRLCHRYRTNKELCINESVGRA